MVKPMKPQVQDRFQTELEQAKAAIATQNFDTAWTALQRAHMLGQRDAIAQTVVHWHMLALAWQQQDFKEIKCQLLPVLIAFPLTLLFGKFRTLRGGKANANSQENSIPEDIKQLLE
jgi:hypothetical protein